MAFGRRTTRIEGIQLAGRRYLERLAASSPRQLVAVVGFSDTARLCHPLAPVGPAFNGLVRALRSLHPRSTTNLSAGLDLALRQLDKVNTCRGHVVLITDGAANEQTDRLPNLSRRARGSHVRIFTIGVGNCGDSDYDRRLLTQLARSTGGRFSSAHSFQALCSALRKAA
jgi:Mg-chelatase subunit ChlD